MLRVTNPARTLVDPMRSLASGCVYEITGVDAKRMLDKKSGFALLQVKE